MSLCPLFSCLLCVLIPRIESSEWTEAFSAFSLDTNKTINPRFTTIEGCFVFLFCHFALLGNKQVGERSNYLLQEKRQFSLKWLSQICHNRFVSSWFGRANNRNIIKGLQASALECFCLGLCVFICNSLLSNFS